MNITNANLKPITNTTPREAELRRREQQWAAKHHTRRLNILSE